MESKPAQSPLVAGIALPHHDLPMNCKGSGSWKVSFIAISGALVGSVGKKARFLKKWIAVLVTGKEIWNKGWGNLFCDFHRAFQQAFFCTRIERKTVDPVTAANVVFLFPLRGLSGL